MHSIFSAPHWNHLNEGHSSMRTGLEVESRLDKSVKQFNRMGENPGSAAWEEELCEGPRSNV